MIMTNMGINTLMVHGFFPAFKGMRNPKNSWDKSDSIMNEDLLLFIGEKDLALARSLIKAGSEHAKFLRMIQVWADVSMPRYWWSEADTYKFGVKNSCSTMHKLMDEEITTDNFVYYSEQLPILLKIIDELRYVQMKYNEAKSEGNVNLMNYYLTYAKRLLPEGFIQTRTWNTNYAEIFNMYNQREHHRLKLEWQEIFCGWCKTLPYFQILCLDK